jgi:hypothetical protein
MNTQKQEITKQISLYIPAELLEKIRAEAAKNYRSLNGEILWRIQQYDAKKEGPQTEESWLPEEEGKTLKR